jgi:hypothetical protein
VLEYLVLEYLVLVLVLVLALALFAEGTNPS